MMSKMMRAWYHMELMSGYGLSEAERICKVMTNDCDSLSPRYRSEFYSKWGISGVTVICLRPAPVQASK